MLNHSLIEKIAKQLQQDDVAALLVAPSHDLMFLVNHKPYLCERFQAFVITANKDVFYICNQSYSFYFHLSFKCFPFYTITIEE